MSWAELLAAGDALRSDAVAVDPTLAELPVVGVGWGTVESDRAVGELAVAVDGPAQWVAQERDPLLGASVRRRDPAPPGGVGLFVLEPDTEGRLAAFLARFGEGVAVVYLADDRAGERIVPLNPRWGPYAVVGRGAAPGRI